MGSGEQAGREQADVPTVRAEGRLVPALGLRGFKATGLKSGTRGALGPQEAAVSEDDLGRPAEVV